MTVPPFDEPPECGGLTDNLRDLLVPLILGRPRQVAAALRVLDSNQQKRPHCLIGYRDLDKAGDMQEILRDPAVWHGQHGNPYVFGFCVTRWQIDIDAPRFLENLGSIMKVSPMTSGAHISDARVGTLSMKRRTAPWIATRIPR